MNIKEILYDLFPGDEIHQAVYGYEVIGDIVMLVVGDKYAQQGPVIAREIINSCPQVRIVGQKTKGYHGEYRTVALKKLAGYGDFSTIHKEFGLKLHVEPDKVYFSPRSGNERNRVTRQVTPGERILVMFSGVGPLPIMMGLHSKASEIIGVEKNPYAHKLATKNLQANGGVENVWFYEGDVREIVPGLIGQFDRVVLPLPFSGELFLTLALQKLRRRGVLHFYDVQRQGEFRLAELKVLTACQAERREVTSSAIAPCGHVGTRKYRICVDARIS